MRLIKLTVPQGAGRSIAEFAFKSGIKEASLTSAEIHSESGVIKKDVVDFQTSTPLAKNFIEQYMESDLYDPENCSVNLRQPQSLFASLSLPKVVVPIVRPSTDVYQEQYQFTKITISLVVRVFIASVLVSFGLLKDNFLAIVAGLLFLPLQHTLLCISLGLCMFEKNLIFHGLKSFLLITILTYLGGVLVGLLYDPPVEHQFKDSILTGALFAAVIGIASGTASVDDVGRREMIGLATAAHITVYPSWFGLQTVYGLDLNEKTFENLYTFLINIMVLTITSGITFRLAGMNGKGIRKFTTVKSD